MLSRKCILISRIAVTCGMLGMAGLLGAQENPKADRPEYRPDHNPFADFVKQADLNGDGKVTREEFDQIERISKLPEEKRTSLFQRLDRNGDGVITEDELRRPTPSPNPPRWRSQGPVMPPLSKLDTNGDGAVSFEEFKAGDMVRDWPEEKQREFFARLDRNNDGVLSSLDWPEHRSSRRAENERIAKIFKEADRDGDGKLNLHEFRAALRAYGRRGNWPNGDTRGRRKPDEMTPGMAPGMVPGMAPGMAPGSWHRARPGIAGKLRRENSSPDTNPPANPLDFD